MGYVCRVVKVIWGTYVCGGSDTCITEFCVNLSLLS